MASLRGLLGHLDDLCRFCKADIAQDYDNRHAIEQMPASPIESDINIIFLMRNLTNQKGSRHKIAYTK